MKGWINLKEQLLEACTSFLDERIQAIQHAARDLEEALHLETKSSAGDKYETGRAMLHQELEKLSAQGERFHKSRRLLKNIDPSQLKNRIELGALVMTSGKNYFLSIPSGEFCIEGLNFICVSPSAPIARAMIGKNAGDTFVFNGEELVLNRIS